MSHRTDISKYLIHSVRKPNQNDFPKEKYDFDENHYLPLTYGENLNNEFEVLTNIIREGGLRADLSFRKGKSTIYGNIPVICFTEMPLINFLQYVNLRNDRTRFTEYGVALLKKEIYENGGRPVISGLSSDIEFKYEDASKRILKSEILPLAEQYRYVKLDLSAGNDWTHEREWRIACKTEDFTVHDDYHGNSFTTYGLNIFSDLLFSEVILIINTEQEVKNIFQNVQDQLDSGYADGGQEFCNNIKYLIVEKALAYINNHHINSIEELPEDIYYSHAYETISEIEKEKVTAALKKCSDLSKDFAEEFFRLYNLNTEQKKQNFDVSGFARVASYKSDNKFYRYLLSENLGSAVSGSLWLHKISEYDMHLQSITYQEYLCKRYCEILNIEIADIFGVSSNLD
jgi:DNA-binding XRE family transcriptional regulator